MISSAKSATKNSLSSLPSRSMRRKDSNVLTVVGMMWSNNFLPFSLRPPRRVNKPNRRLVSPISRGYPLIGAPFR
jgi:hypothetical protein